MPYRKMWRHTQTTLIEPFKQLNQKNLQESFRRTILVDFPDMVLTFDIFSVIITAKPKKHFLTILVSNLTIKKRPKNQLKVLKPK